MKLYVWQYTAGRSVALAGSVDEARKLVRANAAEEHNRVFVWKPLSPDAFDDLVTEEPEVYEVPVGFYWSFEE